MADVHQYVGFENLNLNVAQRNQLYDEIRQLGPSTSPSPAMLLQERLRLDSDAGFWEASFNETKITVAAIKQWLADIFSIQPGDISHDTTIQSFAGGTTEVTTFVYNATNYLRLAIFGCMSCGWRASGDECRGYLSLYRDLWENEA